MGTVTGTTTHRLDVIKTYDINEPYKVGVNGVTSVIEDNGKISEVSYTIDGINYTTTFITGGETNTTFSYSPSPLQEDDYFVFKNEVTMGVVFSPKIEEELFIDRKPISVFDSQIRLSNIDTMEDLERYNNGYYNIIRT